MRLIFFSQRVDFTLHPDASRFERGSKVVYYQENPLPNWGPGSRAKNIINTPGPVIAGNEAERKLTSDQPESRKRMKLDDGGPRESPAVEG